MPTPENIENLQKHFDTAVEEVTAALVRQQDELKQLGTTDDKTATIIEKLDGRITDIAVRLDEAKEQVTSVQTSLNRPDIAPNGRTIKTLGDILVDSAQFKEMCDRKAYESRPIGIDKVDFKTLSSAATSVGPAILDQRVPGLIGDPLVPERRIRDLVPTLPTQSAAIEFVRETFFDNLTSDLSVAVTGGATNPITVDNAQGFFPGQTIQIDKGGGNEESVVIAAGGVNLANGQLTLTGTTTNSHAIDIKVTGVNFVGTTETNLKPEANMGFELITVNARTIAHWVPASRQIMDDVPALRAYVNSRLRDGLTLAEERQLLYGSGTDPEIWGLISDPDIQTYLWSSGVTGDTKLDAIRRAATLAMLAHYPVDGVVVHPSDWEDIELQKGSDGHYLWVTVPSGGGLTVWRMPVVVTTSIDPGDFLLGAFRMGTTVWDREQANMRVSEHHADFFPRNMIAILLEERIAQSIYRPQAFVHGSFDSAP